MSQNADSPSFQSLTRHETFYIPTADLSFLLGHVQFRVHRYFFERESSFFRGQLTTPASPGATRQGSTDTNPLVLKDVKPTDFEKLLWVFYNPRYSLYEADVEDWSAILTLAHRWGFGEVKALAVRELEKKEVSDIDRIVIYQYNDVDRNLLIPRYAALCEREQPLTLPEGLKLGMETTLVIASAREFVRANKAPNGVRSPTSPTVRGEELFNVVRDLFGIPPILEITTEDIPQPSSSSGGLLQKLKLTSHQPQQTPRKQQTPATPTATQTVSSPQPTGTGSKKTGKGQRERQIKQTKMEVSTPTGTPIMPTIDQVLQPPVKGTKTQTKEETNQPKANVTNGEDGGDKTEGGEKAEGNGEAKVEKVHEEEKEKVGKEDIEEKEQAVTTQDEITTVTNGDSHPTTAGSEEKEGNVLPQNTANPTLSTPSDVKHDPFYNEPKAAADPDNLSFPAFENKPLIDLDITAQDSKPSNLPAKPEVGERTWTAQDVSG